MALRGPWGRLERAVDLGALLVLLTCLLAAGGEVGSALATHWRMGLTYLVLLTAGELTRVRLPTGRIIAPIASGTSMALVISFRLDGEPTFDVSTPVALVFVGVGVTFGLFARRLLGMETATYVAAARFLGVAVVAILARVDWTSHPALVTRVAHGGPVWPPVLLLFLVAILGVVIELLLTGVVRAERTRTPAIGALRDELGDAIPITAAKVASGPLVALLQPVIGLAGLVLALFPMTLTYLSMHRYVLNRLTYRQTILTLSRLTEAGGYTRVAHAERVAHLSVRVGRAMGLVERELRDIEYAALLHDLGQVVLREPIPGGATVLAAPDDQRRIAEEGARIVRRTPGLARVARYIETQATPFRQVREFGEDVPAASRIIKVVNAYDDLTAGTPTPRRQAAALERMQLGMGYEYDPEVLDHLIAILDEELPATRGRALHLEPLEPGIR